MLAESKITVRSGEAFSVRKPTEDDGREMFRIVKESNVLDVNSSYSYLMWGKYFNSTSIVAESKDNEVVGFVSGFLLPESDDTLFVWQVGVDKKQRGKGLATKLITELIKSVQSEQSVRYLEATVTPSNIPSSNLFKGIATKYETNCFITECFSEEQFPDEDGTHEAEMAYRIGPIRTK